MDVISWIRLSGFAQRLRASFTAKAERIQSVRRGAPLLPLVGLATALFVCRKCAPEVTIRWRYEVAGEANGMDLTDKEHVQRCCDGHPEDFRVLVRRYQGPLFSYLTGRLGDRSQAEEAAQESFVRAFQSLAKLRKPESFYSWLLGIAGRVVKEEFRYHKRQQRDRETAETMLANSADCPEEYALDEAIAVLPETYRQVILLRYYEELSCQEVAQRLDMPLGTVTKTLSRAYAMLRQELQARDGDDRTINQTEHP